MKEIIRCLKRFVAYEVFGILRGGPLHSDGSGLFRRTRIGSVTQAPVESEPVVGSAVDRDQHVEQISSQ